MKKQILLVALGIMSLAISSCSKESTCQTCTTSDAPNVRVEVCIDKATTYEGNMVILEGELGGLSVAEYTAILELSSNYKCK